MSASAREVLAKAHCKATSWCKDRDDHCKMACLATATGLTNGGHYTVADKQIAALSAAGFVIVPREPTEAMRVAGCKNVASWWTAGRDTMPYGHEPDFIWSAMLSAAEGKK